MELAKTDVEGAVARLTALVDLLAASPSSDKATQQVAELARMQLARLKASQALLEREHLELIRERLAAADKLAAHDRKQAEKIWRGVVELYGDRKFAEDLVAKARSRLTASPP
jgi:hypothetical protein